MMRFIRSLLGLNNSNSTARSLSHPRDLRAGDFIKFGYLPQPDISAGTFEVAQVNTYMYGEMCYPELVLKDGTGQIVFMMVDEEDGEEYIALSKKVQKADMNEIISATDMRQVLEESRGTTFENNSKPEHLSEWLVGKYTKTDHELKGTYVRGDVRYLSNEQIAKNEPFTSYILEDSDGEYALEIEAYDSGEIELCATVYHDISDIDEMWPSSNA